MNQTHSEPPSADGRTLLALRSLLVALFRRPVLWLALGTLLLAASQLRFGIGALAWVAPIPFLRYSRTCSGWRGGLALGAASFVGWTLAVAKIATAPLEIWMSVMFSAPIALALSIPYLLVRPIRHQLGECGAVLAFAALMVAGEWTLHAALPFGVWGAAANTQLGHLDLLQLASVTGLHGVSFLVYLVAASAESLLAAPSRGRGVFAAAAIGVVGVVMMLGQARLSTSSATGMPQSRVAAVGTDSTVGIGPMPSADVQREVEAGLFERTRKAAHAGADSLCAGDREKTIRTARSTAKNVKATECAMRSSPK